jgi:hypothetical protein
MREYFDSIILSRIASQCCDKPPPQQNNHASQISLKTEQRDANLKRHAHPSQFGPEQLLFRFVIQRMHNRDQSGGEYDIGHGWLPSGQAAFGNCPGIRTWAARTKDSANKTAITVQLIQLFQGRLAKRSPSSS